MGPLDEMIRIGLGVAVATLGLLFHYHRYRATMNQIADDVEWHVGFRDRTH